MTPFELKVLQLGQLVRKDQQEQSQSAGGGQTTGQREASKAHYRQEFYDDAK